MMRFFCLLLAFHSSGLFAAKIAREAGHAIGDGLAGRIVLDLKPQIDSATKKIVEVIKLSTAHGGENFVQGCGVLSIGVVVAMILWKAVPQKISCSQEQLMQGQTAALIRAREQEVLQNEYLGNFVKCLSVEDSTEGCDQGKIVEDYVRVGGDPARLHLLQNLCVKQKQKEERMNA